MPVIIVFLALGLSLKWTGRSRRTVFVGVELITNIYQAGITYVFLLSSSSKL